MRAYDLILKKRNGGRLSKAELRFLINGYVKGTVPDYQMAAFLMAVYFRGMTRGETYSMTMAMLDTGDRISLDNMQGLIADKHSTGGVGDTASLVVTPLVAAAGVPVAKISGRGLGHTGGTLDKLESIPGFRVDLNLAEAAAAVKAAGAVITGQTGNIVPADKMIYALRDVTATVDSLPLMAASIMSKKLAAGANVLLLDVKVGDGAFLKNMPEASALAEEMVEIGRKSGKKVAAVISSMEQPLGLAVGNALEVKEAIHTLQGCGPADLEELCMELGGRILYLAGKAAGPEEGARLLKEKIASGAALEVFRRMIRIQGGDDRVAVDPSLLPRAGSIIEVAAPDNGFVKGIKAEAVGRGAMMLGAGREKKEDKIDPAAGVLLHKKTGDAVNAGEALAFLHTNFVSGSSRVEAARRLVSGAYCIARKPPPLIPLILDVIC